MNADYKTRWDWQVFLPCMMAVIGATALFLSSPQGDPVPQSNVRIALPKIHGAAPLFVGIHHALFAKHDIALTAQHYATSRDAMKAILAGQADLAVVVDNTFMLATMRGEQLDLLASIHRSSRSSSLIARKDRQIRTPADLKGKMIGTIFGTNSHFFIDSLLLSNGIAQDKVTLVNLRAEELQPALASGRVDAVVAWQPILGQLHQAMGSQAVDFFADDLTVTHLNLIGKPQYIEQHQPEIRRMLVAIGESIQFIHANPIETRQIVSEIINIDPKELASVFKPNEFDLSLNQPLLVSLDALSRWALHRQLVNMRAVPNYPDHVNWQALEAVRPSAVRIIH